MCRLYYLVGLPSSGKSKLAEQIQEVTGAEIFSSGKIRRELNGASEQTVFETLDERVFRHLSKNEDCIVDCTNIRSRNRTMFVKKVSRNVTTNCEMICVIVATPFSQCLRNNKRSGNYLPESVIKHFYKSWQTPAHWEGWDQIWIYYDDPRWMGCNGTVDEYIESVAKVKIDNDSSLGRHSCKVVKIVSENQITGRSGSWDFDNLIVAALLHDCGKPICKSSFYNIGAYEALFFDYQDWLDPVYISNLINWQTSPDHWKHEDMKKCIRRFGYDFFSDIRILHEANLKLS